MENRDIYNIVYGNNPQYNQPVPEKIAYLKNWLVRGSGSVVDAGCGDGIYVREILNLGIDVVGFDISDVCVSKVCKELPIIRDDIVSHAVEHRYSRLICMDVLEHIKPEDLEANIASLAAMAPTALIGVANHSDVHCGFELHLIQQCSGWWLEVIRKYYEMASLVMNLSDRWYLFECATIPTTKVGDSLKS